MKFSKEKKAKMRKYRNRKIKRVYNEMSYTQWWWTDENGERWDSVDYATFRKTCYILAENEDCSEYAIFKMVSDNVSESVKLSSKRIMSNRQTFINPSVWNEKSEVVISQEGVIEKVDVGAHNKPINFGGGIIIICPIY